MISSGFSKPHPHVPAGSCHNYTTRFWSPVCSSTGWDVEAFVVIRHESLVEKLPLQHLLNVSDRANVPEALFLMRRKRQEIDGRVSNGRQRVKLSLLPSLPPRVSRFPRHVTRWLLAASQPASVLSHIQLHSHTPPPASPIASFRALPTTRASDQDASQEGHHVQSEGDNRQITRRDSCGGETSSRCCQRRAGGHTSEEGNH